MIIIKAITNLKKMMRKNDNNDNEIKRIEIQKIKILNLKNIIMNLKTNVLK